MARMTTIISIVRLMIPFTMYEVNHVDSLFLTLGVVAAFPWLRSVSR